MDGASSTLYTLATADALVTSGNVFADAEGKNIYVSCNLYNRYTVYSVVHRLWSLGCNLGTIYSVVTLGAMVRKLRCVHLVSVLLHWAQCGTQITVGPLGTVLLHFVQCGAQVSVVP